MSARRSLADAAPAAGRARPDTGWDAGTALLTPPQMHVGMLDGPGAGPILDVSPADARRSLAGTRGTDVRADSPQMGAGQVGGAYSATMPGTSPFPAAGAPIDGSPSVGVPYLGPHVDSPANPLYAGPGGGGRGEGPGGPGGGWSGGDGEANGGPVARVTKAVSRLRILEGPRGVATRLSVVVRYTCYFLAILLCSSISHIAFQTSSVWRSAGQVMFFSASLMLVASALSTMFYANYRSDIIRQARHYIFGIAVVPGTGLAIFQWAITRFLNSPAANTDSFASVLHSAVPILYFVTVCIPALILIKYVSGIRTMHRTNLDDQEMLAIITRQDGLQR